MLACPIFGNGPASVAQVVEALKDSKFYGGVCAFIFIVALFVTAPYTP